MTYQLYRCPDIGHGRRQLLASRATWAALRRQLEGTPQRRRQQAELDAAIARGVGSDEALRVTVSEMLAASLYEIAGVSG